MRIGNRLFPYPVLNSKKELTDYLEECAFNLTFETDENNAPIVTNDSIVLRNVTYELKCDTLQNLVNQGSACVKLVIECSQTVYRKVFDLESDEKDISIKRSNVDGNVSITCILLASTDIYNLESTQFLSEYKGMSFNVKANDILAVDDEVRFKIERDTDEDKRVSSIFRIVRLNDPVNQIIGYSNEKNKIEITLPSTIYDAYDNIKMQSTFNSFAFAVIAIPVLMSCLDEIKSCLEDEDNDFEIYCEEYTWLKSVRAAYFEATKEELSLADFKKMSSFEIAQIVLNNAACNSLSLFNNMVVDGEIGADLEEITNDKIED